jgi:hypothetical protein
MICRKCGRSHEGTVGFKAVCEGCGAWLHCCLQCSLYDSGARRCRSSTTDPVRDRDTMNYCEEFRASGAPPGEDGDGRDGARSRFMDLFGGEG